MNTTAQQWKFGFTLIEIVVVVGIMGVLLLAGVASYGRTNERAKVEQAAISISTQLRSWQKRAESGIGSDACGGGVFGGIEVSNSGPDTFEARVVCDGAPAGNAMEFLVPNDCEVDPVDSFILKPLGRGVSEAREIVVFNPRLVNLRYTVAITLSGGINVVKTNL